MNGYGGNAVSGVSVIKDQGRSFGVLGQGNPDYNGGVAIAGTDMKKSVAHPDNDMTEYDEMTCAKGTVDYKAGKCMDGAAEAKDAAGAVVKPTAKSGGTKQKPYCTPHYIAVTVRGATKAAGTAEQSTTNKLIIEGHASAWSARSVDKFATILTAPTPKKREGAAYLAAGAAIAAVAATLF